MRYTTETVNVYPDEDKMLSRIGCFFLFIGGLLLLVFFFSDVHGMPVYQMLGAGILLVVLGGIMRKKSYKPPAPSERFRLIRLYQQRRREKQDIKK